LAERAACRSRLRRKWLMADTKRAGREEPSPVPPTPAPLAPVLMMAFWALLGGAAGIKFTQSIWQLLGWAAGEVSVAVPVGGAVGAVCGALLGLITSPRLLVLLMAVFAGSSAGAVAGQLPWGDVGRIGGQVAGGLVGGIAWATWLYFGREKDRPVSVEDRRTRSGGGGG
jgi:hypothetical protein